MFDFERLRSDFRKKLQYKDSSRSLASKIGVDFNLVFRLIRSTPKSMDVNNIKKICDYLGKKVDDYFTSNDDQITIK